MRFLTQRRLWMSCLSSATGRGSGSQFTRGQFLEQAPLAVAESVDCQYGEVRGRQEQFNAFCESKPEDFRWPSVALGSGTLPNSTTSEASRPLETWLVRQSEDLVDVWVTETPQQETKVSEALKLNKSYRAFLTPSQTQNCSATTAQQDTRISEGMMLDRSYHLLPAFLTPSQTQNGVAKMAQQETKICEGMIVDRCYYQIPAFVTPSHDLLENSRPLARRFEHRLWGLQKQSAALEGLVGGRRQFCSAAAAKQDATKKFRNSVPVRSLVQPLPKKAGRNHSGQITIRHRGGGHKRAYRIIDFRRQDKDGVQATVSGIEYDPNRTARIALLNYTDGVKSYILAPRGLVAGDEVAAGPDADIRPGNALPLSHIPVGTTVHAIELRPGGGAQLARSAGSGAQLMRKEGKLAQLRLPSSEVRNVDVRCRATIGEVGFAERANVKWRKAGQRRWLGWRPTVRGVAMNPVDHPHGGGEGRTSGGRHPVNPSGKREGRTRRPKASDALIVRRRKSKK